MLHIFSQFGYCPLVWMFHSRKLNNRLNNIHERALKIIYRDYESNFQQLLKQNSLVSIHHRNLQTLATKIFKTKSGLNPVIMEDVFKFKNLAYNFWNAGTLNRNNVNSVKYGTETITSLGAKIWKILPNDYKELISLSTFKSKIKNWETDKCSCRLRKTYIQWVGFVSLGIVTSDQCLLSIIFVAVVVCMFVVAIVVVAVYYYYFFIIIIIITIIVIIIIIII